MIEIFRHFISSSFNRTFASNFTVMCDKKFNEDDVIMVSYLTPESFTGQGWVGLVPAGIRHYNESINWRHNYAWFWFHGE